MARGAGRVGAGRRARRPLQGSRAGRGFHARLDRGDPDRTAPLVRGAGRRGRLGRGGAGAAGATAADGRYAASPADPEALRDRVTATVTGLLALAGIAADPVRDREGILLSAIFEQAWTAGRDLDLAALIAAVQKPPFEQVGVIPLDAFFPDKDRFALALALNNLLASPGFAAWREGEPLEIPRLLFTPEGKPRLAVLSIAHLSDAERMFFVTLLLNELVAWMRTQPGTTSLRALLYMDEVFGFFPPVANPPSKKPMLTLLKQARAFGIGVVLATQNPVDLDYKALANAGMWFVGRLQTDRDRDRVLEGLEGAAASTGKGFDRAAMAATMGALGKRVFLLSSIYEEGPVSFQTRWALSYLRGPLTRTEIQRLRGGATGVGTGTGTGTGAAAGVVPSREAPGSGASPRSGARPVIPSGLNETFLPGPVAAAPVYRPALLGHARAHFVAAKLGVDAWRELAYLAPLETGTDLDDPWTASAELPGPPAAGAPAPDGARFIPPPSDAFESRRLARWDKGLGEHVYRTATLAVFVAPVLEETSRAGEREAEFRARLALIARERRDAALEDLKKRYAVKVERLQEGVRKAEERHARESSQLQERTVQTAVNTGAAIFGALFGRRRSFGGVGRAIGGASKTVKEKDDVTRAAEGVTEAKRKLEELEAEVRAEIARLDAAHDPAALAVEVEQVKPRKADTATVRIALAWRAGLTG